MLKSFFLLNSASNSAQLSPQLLALLITESSAFIMINAFAPLLISRIVIGPSTGLCTSPSDINSDLSISLITLLAQSSSHSSVYALLKYFEVEIMSCSSSSKYTFTISYPFLQAFEIASFTGSISTTQRSLI